jgi:hypothetical protein
MKEEGGKQEQHWSREKVFHGSKSAVALSNGVSEGVLQKT